MYRIHPYTVVQYAVPYRSLILPHNDITVYGSTAHRTYTVDIRPSAVYGTACSPITECYMSNRIGNHNEDVEIKETGVIYTGAIEFIYSTISRHL